MKETGTLHWLSPNTGATNESGFTGLGKGFRFHDGTFDGINGFTSYWSSNESGPGSGYARVRQLYCNVSSVGIFGVNKLVEFSVRCLKNE